MAVEPLNIIAILDYLILLPHLLLLTTAVKSMLFQRALFKIKHHKECLIVTG
jgi:hypothetical protein